MEILSNRLLNLRKEKKLTRPDVANAIGISLKSYQRYETGEREPNASVLAALADLFGVSIDYLLGQSEGWSGPNGVILHVYYTGTPEAIQAFLEDLRREGLPETVRAEDGCLQYDYFLSCQQGNTLLLLEHWRDAAALERHSGQPHMDRIKHLKPSRGLETRIERYE